MRTTSNSLAQTLMRPGFLFMSRFGLLAKLSAMLAGVLLLLVVFSCLLFNHYNDQAQTAASEALALKAQSQSQTASSALAVVEQIKLLEAKATSHHRMAIAVVLSTIFLLLLNFYLSWCFYRHLQSAVGDLKNAAQAVASGDLTKELKVHGRDDLAHTMQAMDKGNFNLSALVANVRTNASMVAVLGEELSAGIRDMAQRTEQQATSLLDTSQRVDNLNLTVRENAVKAKSVDNLASNVRSIAETGNEIMRSAVETMQGIQSSALKVHEIVSMIDKIAFQTDILALNAAVEAAHAGEQGRGFAVVANEVRGLAQRTAESARQIRHLIDDSVQRVETGVEQIHQVNITLSDIVDGIRHLAGDINAISTASSEQSQGLLQITQAVQELDEITKSNTEMAEHAKSASTELEARAAKLTSVVSAFRLRQGTADEAHALVKKAMALFKTHGMGVLDLITVDATKVYADRDMYVFAFDRRGQYRAFAGNRSKLSVNLFNVPGLDGKKLVEDAFDLPAKGGWVDYAIENPLLNRVEWKTSYIERISEDVVLGCGVYKSV